MDDFVRNIVKVRYFMAGLCGKRGIFWRILNLMVFFVLFKFLYHLNSFVRCAANTVLIVYWCTNNVGHLFWDFWPLLVNPLMRLSNLFCHFLSGCQLFTSGNWDTFQIKTVVFLRNFCQLILKIDNYHPYHISTRSLS